MTFDFSKLNLKDRPILILKTLSGRILQTLGYAKDISLKIMYNEVSELSFEVPTYVDGEKTPHCDELVGWNVIELKDLGQFLLMDPKTQNTGLKETKNCTAYSLEFEWTFKKLALKGDVYNFWNPVAPDDTILGMIMDMVPSWHLGTVSPTLIGVYRTFDGENKNLYDFVKSDVQKSVGCIFEFDTMTRTVNVRDVSSRTSILPIYLSTQNLIKKIEISEDSQGIVTCLDVNGAEGVDIMGVNPTGLNKLYNLDYFMTETHFDKSTIAKWNSWKKSCEDYRQYYFDVTMERALKTSQYLTEQAKMAQLQSELKNLESMQAGVIQADDDNEYKQPELEKLKKQIDEKNNEISEQQSKLNQIMDEISEISSRLENVNKELSFSTIFTQEELAALNLYFKEDEVTESTFVAPVVKSYNVPDESSDISNLSFHIGPCAGMSVSEPGITVTKITDPSQPDKTLYSIRGGELTYSGFTANINRGSLEWKGNQEFVFTANLGNGASNDRKFKSGCISMTGTCVSITDNTVSNPDENTPPHSYAEGTELDFDVTTGYLYFTENLTEYQQRAIEWDLLEWGEDTMEKLSTPSYTFSIDSANFLALEDFEEFKKNLTCGCKCYLQLDKEKLLQPICIGISVSFSDLSKMELEFSDTYNSKDEFWLKDLLDKSVSMGKNVDYSKYTYSSFVESGASTYIDDFIHNSLDVAKNNILTATGQALSWNENGLRLRKWNDDRTGYEPEQIWAINNELVFSDDDFRTVKTAVGKIKVGNAWMYGVSGEALLGSLIAGRNLIIESEKKVADPLGNTKSVFRFDSDGAAFHNANINIYSGANQHISINPDIGFAMGDYPVYKEDGTIDFTKAKVFFDIKNGKAFFKGNIEADGGSFRGTVTATDFLFQNGDSVKTLLGGKEKLTQIPSDAVNFYGLNILNKSDNSVSLSIDTNGNVSLKGNITMKGGSINWASVGHDPLASDAYSYASGAMSAANSASSLASSLVNGQYYGGSFINGREIYSPTIYVGTPGAAIASLGFGTGQSGGSETNAVSINSSAGLLLQANGGGLGLQASSGVWAKTEFHFQANAFVRSGGNLYIANGSSWLNVLTEINSLKNRVSALEKG